MQLTLNILLIKLLEMRVAVYNQMFGLDGRSFLGNVIGHYYVHWQKNPKKVFSRAKLEKTFEIARKSKADIIGVCEIYEGTEKEIVKGLKRMGYKYFYFGRGHRFKHNNRHVIELVASKIKGRQLNYNMWPLENRMGGGGGFVVCKFPGFNIFHVHLGMPIRNFFKGQIKYMQEINKNFKGKTILMGDFNYSYQDLKEYFPDFELSTEEIKTCSLTPIIKFFYNKDIDHIMINGLKAGRIGTLEGRSDHKLIYADLN